MFINYNPITKSKLQYYNNEFVWAEEIGQYSKAHKSLCNQIHFKDNDCDIPIHKDTMNYKTQFNHKFQFNQFLGQIKAVHM